MTARPTAYVAGIYEHPERVIATKSLAQVYPEIVAGVLADAGEIIFWTRVAERMIDILDAYTGEVLSAVDMTSLPGVTATLGNPSTCSIGPILRTCRN